MGGHLVCRFICLSLHNSKLNSFTLYTSNLNFSFSASLNPLLELQLQPGLLSFMFLTVPCRTTISTFSFQITTPIRPFPTISSIAVNFCPSSLWPFPFSLLYLFTV
ncbi:hypothetical protein V6Z11_D08G013700 [Gossypium hirsutum]